MYFVCGLFNPNRDQQQTDLKIVHVHSDTCFKWFYKINIGSYTSQSNTKKTVSNNKWNEITRAQFTKFQSFCVCKIEQFAIFNKLPSLILSRINILERIFGETMVCIGWELYSNCLRFTSARFVFLLCSQG